MCFRCGTWCVKKIVTESPKKCLFSYTHFAGEDMAVLRD